MLGGVIGGLGGHFKKGISRDDAKVFGDLIEAGQATLLVIGELVPSKSSSTRRSPAPRRRPRKEIDVDSKEFKRELDQAEKEYATS